MNENSYEAYDLYFTMFSNDMTSELHSTSAPCRFYYKVNKSFLL